MKRFFLLIAASFCAALTWADVTLPGWMTSNMVLQQRTKVHLQATAKKGATVKITPSWDGKTVKVVADKQTGAFGFDLDVPSAGGPFTLAFDDGKKLVLDNVMAGEVWFCSGQSNMEMPVKGWGQVLNYEQEVANANHPLIRLFQVKKVVAHTPQTSVPLGHTNGWAVCSPEMVAEFSAAAYFFAREVSEKLGIAVGVVNSSWGGTPAESWPSIEALQNVMGFQDHIKRYLQTGFDEDKINQLYQDEKAEWMQDAFAGDQGLDKGNIDQAIWAATDLNETGWQTLAQPVLWSKVNALKDFDGIVCALPPLAAAVWMTLRSRRPSTCALVAGCALASLPFLVIQGQEVHVGIWSLRRSLPPFALLTLAAFFGALEPAPEESEGPAGTRGLWWRRGQGRLRWTLLLLVCSVAAGVRTDLATLGGGEVGARELARTVESRMDAAPGALFLFDYFSQGAPFTSLPGRAAFGLNDGVAKTLGHARIAAWLRDECEKRPVYVVACSHVEAPILDDGIALVPEGEPVLGTVSRIDGKTFRTAQAISRDLVFSFLRVRPAAPGDTTAVLPGHSPFGLAPGAWDEPRRGKEGRWACDGAAFHAPVPEPGETVEVSLDASWWTRDGAAAPTQTLRLEPPFPGESSEAALEPGPDFRTVTLSVTRDAADVEPRPATGLYRLRASERYDEKGFPPALAVRVRSLFAALAR